MPIESDTVEALEAQLNDFDPQVRATALRELLQRQPQAPTPAREVANMHCHTFFSFNAYGYSPTGLAWLGRQKGYQLMGIVDFDVLDGVDEFLDACALTGVRGSAGIETRVYLPEFANHEMNSPGEPGVLYHMGIGFTTSGVPADAAAVLDELRSQSRQRNLGLIDRVNVHLTPVIIDYAEDVLPLTPLGTATERHIVVAYIQAAKRQYPNVNERTRFWADRLDMARSQIEGLMAEDLPAFQNAVRAKLMKRGGVGYIQPDHDTFPPIDKLHAAILGCDALPCAAWLDGTTSGEQRMDELLDLLVQKGAVALNIVPDRNWDIADEEVRRRKVQNLYDVVDLALEMDLPLNVGTEMNSYGQKLVDEFDAPALERVCQPFIDGAYFVYGHTRLARMHAMGYQSAWSQTHFDTRRQRNGFYTQVGRAVPAGPKGDRLLANVNANMTPDDVLARVVA